MNGLIHFVGATFGRRERRGRSGLSEANACPADLDPLSSYVKVMEEARQRRGRLFSRS